MLTAEEDEDLLLGLLNSTPVVDGGPQDLLGDDREARDWALRHGGSGAPAELAHLRQVRDGLQEVVRGSAAPATLAPLLDGVRMRPEPTARGVRWHLDVPADRRLGDRALLAWGRVQERLPGRLRPCANDECRLFLLDRSRPGTARWCSMRSCGNRLKARRHYQRARGEQA